ncbi:MAG: glutathione S-transferase N-terminal domain-containing protein [Gammaproteobacteria bacterium]|nr:glutathione S-transferase N-terminal domain-containing protein [Gammaproteobacteria bacterium]
MGAVANKRSVMTLFSGHSDPYSHRSRIVLAEKNVTYDVVLVEPGQLPEDLIDLNPYNSVPTLLDRDLVLYNSRVVMEYLDERFPHPPLMPVDPVARARTRLMLHRIDADWYGQVKAIESSDEKKREAGRKELRDSIVSVAPVFEAKPFFMSEEFSLVDCSVAPILWRLNSYGIELPAQAASVKEYMRRLFDRPAFHESLTAAEKEFNR